MTFSAHSTFDPSPRKGRGSRSDKEALSHLARMTTSRNTREAENVAARVRASGEILAISGSIGIPPSFLILLCQVLVSHHDRLGRPGDAQLRICSQVSTLSVDRTAACFAPWMSILSFRAIATLDIGSTLVVSPIRGPLPLGQHRNCLRFGPIRRGRYIVR